MRESLLIKLPVIIGDLFLLNLSWILALTLYPQPVCITRSLEIFACLNICFIPGLSWFGVILSSRIVPTRRSSAAYSTSYSATWGSSCSSRPYGATGCCRCT